MFFVVLAVPLITRYQCRRLRTHDSMLDSRQRGNGWKAPTNIRSVQAKAQCLEWEHACCPHVMPSHRRGQKNSPRLAPPQPPPPSAVVGPMVLCSRRRHCHRRQSRPPDIRRRSHRRPRPLPAATRPRRPAAACGLPPWIRSSRDNACRRRRAAGVCNSEDNGSASTFPIARAPTAVAPLTPSALTRPAGATTRSSARLGGAAPSTTKKPAGNWERKQPAVRHAVHCSFSLRRWHRPRRRRHRSCRRRRRRGRSRPVGAMALTRL